jgi:hypothetical protein
VLSTSLCLAIPLANRRMPVHGISAKRVAPVNGQCEVSTGGRGGTRRWPSMSVLDRIACSGFRKPSELKARGEEYPTGSVVVDDMSRFVWRELHDPAYFR